nr:hypothetical protein [uncultured Campylobacter sp.]
MRNLTSCAARKFRRRKLASFLIELSCRIWRCFIASKILHQNSMHRILLWNADLGILRCKIPSGGISSRYFKCH